MHLYSHVEELRGYYRNMFLWTWDPPDGNTDHQKALSKGMPGFLAPMLAKALKPILK